MAVDLALSKEAGFFDLSITNGDFTSVDNFDTSITVALFADKRADETEIPPAELRRGWWGNPFNGDATFELGSKLWLLYQARNTQDTLNSAIDFAQNALQWSIDDNHAEKVEVNALFTNGTLGLNVKIFRDQSRVENKFFDLWQNSGKTIG